MPEDEELPPGRGISIVIPRQHPDLILGSLSGFRLKKQRNRNSKLKEYVLAEHSNGGTAGSICSQLERKEAEELLTLIGKPKAPSLSAIKRIISKKKRLT